MANNNYIITGGPGTGKSSIIEELKKRGVQCYDEVARSVIIEELNAGSNALPNKNVLAFTRKVVNKMQVNLMSCNSHSLAIFDRGLPDSAGYLRYANITIPKYLVQAIKDAPYAGTVFIAPFWQEIYTMDDERIESHEVAKNIHGAIEATYHDLGYTLVEIPLLSVQDRADFILDSIGV